jgi:hypothetical protein
MSVITLYATISIRYILLFSHVADPATNVAPVVAVSCTYRG